MDNTALVTLADGRKVVIPLSWTKGGTRVLAYIAYGRIVATVGTRFTRERIPLALGELIGKLRSPKASDLSFQSMLDWSAQTVFVLGEKKTITNEAKKKDDPGFFYYRKGSDFTRAFDRVFADYLGVRIKAEASRSKIPLGDFRIRVGHYRSKQASYRATDALFEFDRRVFAYNRVVVDSVIDHELSHIVSIRHDRFFYQTLYRQIPERIYRRSKWIITTGRFASDPYQDD